MKALFGILILVFSSSIFAGGIVVIANPSLTPELTKSDLINIYMGRTKTLSDGSKPLPIDQKDTSYSTESFYKWLVNKDTREVKAYWSRLLFSGRAQPPYQVNNSQDVIDIVSQTPAAIGYVNPRYLTNDVKVLFNVE